MQGLAAENRIVLSKSDSGWMAKWEGPMSVEISKLFGTTELPTGFTAMAPGKYVVAQLQALNPDVAVEMAGAVRS